MPNTREKLIELFFNAEQMVHIPYGMNTKEAERYIFGQMADHLIANGVTVNEWISVKDRLPDLELLEIKEDDKDVFPCLAARKHPRAKNGKYTAKVWYDGYGFIDGISNDVTDEVTHWMPLPEPPKGE